MKVVEFVNKVDNVVYDESIANTIRSCYGGDVPDIVLQAISLSPNGEFFDSDDVCRLLSLAEIVSATRELGVDFLKIRTIPLFDVGDNCFVCYNMALKCWEQYNIVDMISYGQKATLVEMFS